MKIIFFGSDDFAQVHLKALIEGPHDILACVTPPDRARGRGMKVTPTAVKETALEHDIKVLQPADANDKAFVDELKALETELFVVIAYGRILSKEVLSIPRKMPVNVHTSLLPQYRGAAPINWAIISGEKKTGISIIRMNEKMDAGEIIAQKEIAIAAEDTAVTLREKMKKEGPLFLVETIERIDKDEVTLMPQDDSQISFAPKLTKTMGKIDWNQPAEEILNLIRGLQPWPGAYTFYNGKRLKILEAQSDGSGEPAPAGSISSVTKEDFSVAAGDGVLTIKKVHLESAKPVSAREFLIGHSLKVGEKLGG